MQDFSYMTPPESVSFQAMKAKHEEYFARQKRVLDENLSATTWEFLEVQLATDAELPFYLQSIDRVAKAAAASRSASLGHFGRLGGGSKKTDALQELILEVVRCNPRITEPQLLAKLRDRLQQGVIVEIDEDPSSPDPPEIEFNDHHGKWGHAPISGLKDRLSRAKKAIQKEFAQSR